MVQQDTKPGTTAAPMEASMSRERMERFLREPIVAVLSWVTTNGGVASSPVWFEYRDGTFYLHVMTESSKGRSILANPSVSLCIQDPEPPYACAAVEGEARLIDDLPQCRRISALLGAKYMGADRAEEFAKRNGVEGELVVRVRPTKVHGQANIAA